MKLFSSKLLALLMSVTALSIILTPATALAAGECTPSGGSFLGLPTWYQYVPGTVDESGKCRPDLSGPDGKVELMSFLPVLLALIEILLRIAGMAAVIYVIYGGFQYLTSQGNPEGTTKARHTIINALIGLVLAILSVGIVAFIGKVLIT